MDVCRCCRMQLDVCRCCRKQWDVCQCCRMQYMQFYGVYWWLQKIDCWIFSFWCCTWYADASDILMLFLFLQLSITIYTLIVFWTSLRSAYKFVCLLSANHRCVLWPVDQWECSIFVALNLWAVLSKCPWFVPPVTEWRLFTVRI